jgi:DNA (cytosine-5)-methyltransferase 1
MKFGSVSSGIDAASVAFGPLGWKAQWFSEIAAFPSAVLKHHYPDIPNLGDMTKIYGKSEFTDRTVDLICGGTPCQSFSVAGLRGGLSDERGNLSLEFCKIVHTKKSRWVLWENVPGVLSSKDNAFGCFLAALSGAEAPLLPGTRDGKWSKSGIVLGQVYGLAWRVLDAQYFGVPQRRRRVFVVGYLGNWKPAAEVLFEREGLRGNIATGRTERKDITRTTSARASGCGGINYQVNRKVSHGEYTLDNKSSPVLARDYKDSSDLITQYGPVAGTLSARRDSSPCADRGMNIVYNIGHASEGVGCLSGDHESRPTDTGHCVVEKHTVRRLTPVECERLQGFPDNYTRIAWRGKPAEQCPDGPRGYKL